MKRFLCPEAGVFVFCWFLLMLFGRDQFFSDPGSLWHIVVGEKILREGNLPHSDPFSFSRSGEPWLAQWWLAECAMAWLARLGGLDLVVLATVTLMAAFLTWLYSRFLRSQMNALLAVLMIAFGMLGTLYHFHPRPHLFTIFFVGWTCAQLCDFEAGRISLGSLFCLVPLYVLWANIHGGMVGGVVCLAAVGMAWCVTPWIGGPAPLAGKRWFLYVGLVVLCGLSALANPYGVELPRVWLALMTSPVLPRLMVEHGPLWSAGNVAWAVLLQAVIYLAALLSVSPRRWHASWLLPLVWLALTWSRIRYGPLFTVSSMVVLADMYPSFGWADWLARRGSIVFRRRTVVARPGLLNFSIPILLVAISTVLKIGGVPFPVLGAGWARMDPEQVTSEMLQTMRDYERASPDGTPIFNDMQFGGFLIYNTPGLRVFIDDRCELYGDEGLLQYARAVFEDPAQIDRWQKQYHFDAALVKTGSKIDIYLRNSDDWALSCETASATFFQWKKK